MIGNTEMLIENHKGIENTSTDIRPREGRTMHQRP